MFDQPAGLLSKLTLAMNVYLAVNGAKKADDWSAWAKENPQLAEIWTWVSKVRDAN